MRFVGKEYRKHSNPFIIGLLNGLMIICGPLQAMYVMAAGTGSWSGGAAILFFFGLGTLPLLLGFGFLTSLLSANLTPKLLKASGVIVIILGTVMLNRGLAVTGSGRSRPVRACVAKRSPLALRIAAAGQELATQNGTMRDAKWELCRFARLA